MKDITNKVATIVVTFNRLSLLKECITSLRQQTYTNHQIIVINNGSTDDTLNWLNQQDDIYVITQENLGGAGGFFTGLKYACEKGFKFCWVMDDDVIPDKDALLNLIKHADITKGFLCSRVIDNNGDLCNVPKICDIKSNKTGEPIWGNKLSSGLLQVDRTSFVSFFICSDSIYELGLPYKEYFIWGDDTEFSARISAHYPSYMAIDSIVEHRRKIGAVLSIVTETDSNRAQNHFYWHRNRIHLQKSFIGKMKMIILSIWDMCQVIGKLDFYKVPIILKALFASLFFNPSIEKPQR